MATSPEFSTKQNELISTIAALEAAAADLKQFVQPSFDLHAFHNHYDPLVQAANAAHDLYHELLHLQGDGHGH
jgi:ABC-type transporter Mla subunit MlaD